MKPAGPATWTTLAVLQWAREYLLAKGISEPRAAAEVLLAHCLNCPRLDLYLRHDQPLSESELSCYKTLLKRRLAHEPTQYITGHQEFWSLDFLVTPAVLIPRPETELVVESVLDYVKQEGLLAEPLRVLDVGVGSGVLTVALATELPHAWILAVDRSSGALQVARKNIRRHGVERRASLVAGDLVAPLARREYFHIIVANPPYVPTAEWERLPPEIREHEPRLALDGGPDGLAVIRALAAAVPGILQPGGLLAMEVGQGQAETVVQLLQVQGSFAPAVIVPDYQRIGRVVTARKLGS